MVRPKKDSRNHDYRCPIRYMSLSIEDNSGERCYTGGDGNICNVTGELCTIYQLDEQAKSNKVFIDRHMSELSDEELVRIAEGSPKVGFNEEVDKMLDKLAATEGRSKSEILNRALSGTVYWHEATCDSKIPSKLKWL